MTEQLNSNSRYQFIGLIGKGRLGDVYRVGDNFFRREVALKTLRKETASPEFIQYFGNRYAQLITAQSKLSNPSIIHTYDFTYINNIPAWTMDLLSGNSFTQYSGQQMPVEQAANLLIPVADALSYAHQYGFVHGNLKPSNILIGANQTPVLTDFGLAQWLSENGHGYGGFEANCGIGSPEYLAPEQAQGMQADARTDVYSLGIIFYELVTGRRPFSAVSPLETMARQVSDQLPSPRYFIPTISQQAEQFLYQATAKNPAGRMSTMGEFGMMLRTLASGTQSGAYYPPASYYNNAVPSEDDDDDDEDGIGAKIKGAVVKFKESRNAKIIAIALIALIVAGIIIGIISGNNRQIQAMNATSTQEMVQAEQTQEAVRLMIENQAKETADAVENENIRRTEEAAVVQTQSAIAAMQPTATMVPVADLSSSSAVPTAVVAGSGRFQSQTPADGSNFVLGEGFNVVWTLENTGSSNWTTDYKLIFNSGTNFSTGLVKEINLPGIVWPGGALGITLPCTAPTTLGNYSMQWYLADGNGNTVFTPLTININVIDGELTPTPAPTQTPEPTSDPANQTYYDADSGE